jgi:carbamoylphosphate synthase small subunit
VKDVTTQKKHDWKEGCWKWCVVERGKAVLRVVVYDFGVKFNILRNLVEAGFEVTVVPAQTPAEAVLGMNPDGIILSNGPGDPQTVTYAIGQRNMESDFGICLITDTRPCDGRKDIQTQIRTPWRQSPCEGFTNSGVEITPRTTILR